MKITVQEGYGAGEAQAVAEMQQSGFEGGIKDYTPSRTEPHSHDYDVCLYVLDGQIDILEAEQGITHSCPPGSKVYVPAGTPHAEEHGALKMIVGRRPQPSGGAR